ncbi:MAG: hypothetical protein ACTSVY_08425 [Candidatus Helarchaeota archaeon]
MTDKKECKICFRTSIKDGYCKYHLEAFSNLKKTYDDWKKAYNDKLEFKDYLKKLVMNKYTGEWVREVAIELMKNEE